ncbi:MAG: hypothetical protein GX653_08515 [Clostridiales bacterium]|nr:hypothetical protein [Clostridiales bacterium]
MTQNKKADTTPSPIRLSVRALVEFSVFEPDIMPFSAALMEEGRLAHVGRQKASAARSEVPLQWSGRRQGLDFQITGRMDLYDPTLSPPLVEEIKLCRGDAPAEARRAHRYQALCYAYMLCLQEGLPAIAVRVSYASTAGELRAAFDEVCTVDELEAVFCSLLDQYAAWHRRLLRHRARRDESLARLPFPYPQYREGQRTMAEQVYLAILRKKRLFAVMPTGTGKSAAVLYPALKALGMGLSEQIFCLTARGTARRAMEGEIERMNAQGLRVKSLTLNAKEKICPMDEVRCDPMHCPRAAGHYLRQEAGLLAAMRARGPWDTAFVQRMADRHMLCPFEYSLALSVLADVVIGDYNYALDPRVHIQRIFDRPGRVTVLCDEAHNLPDRVRDMLSGELSGALLAAFRRDVGRAMGRVAAIYRRAGALLKTLRSLEDGGEVPPALAEHTEALMSALRAAPHLRVDSALMQQLLGFQDALRRQQAQPEDYRLFVQPQGREQRAQLLCLHFTPYLREVSAPFCGFVCYSATLSPLTGMRDLLGGEAEDACFELPSPFPPEHLLALSLPVNTRWGARQGSIPLLCGAIHAMYAARPGKYIAFFPSYAYLRDAAEHLSDLPLHVQQSGMDEAARDQYLARFTADGEPLLGLCVLGGVFAEGVDLPGLALIGVCIAGVGLPQVGPQRDAIRLRADQQGLDGFDVAYRHPGMHKVLQAAGRLIRSEKDRGVLLLCDDRYRQPGYRALLPAHWQVQPAADEKGVAALADAFWSGQ